jgi:outer membrane protein assembly factor BamB
MPEWSRRSLLAAIGAAGSVGGGWLVFDRTRCRPLFEPQWTYTGRRRLGPSVPSENDLLVPEGYGVTGDTDHRLAALEPFSAQAQWSVVLQSGGFGVPVRADDTVYVGTGLDAVRALDADTGRRLWVYDPAGREEHGGGAWGQPLVTDGRVHIGISHASDPNADPTDPDEFTHRVVAVITDDGTVAFVDVTDGTIRRTRKPLRGATSVASAGDTLYVGGERGFDSEGDTVERPRRRDPDRYRWSHRCRYRRSPVAL